MIEANQTEDGKKTTQALAAGGFLAGMLAMSCCVWPLFFLSVGISGAWISQLTALAPYQPLFLSVSIGALGLGFWRAYRRKGACEPDTLCARPAVPRSTKALLWLGAAAIVATLGVNTVAPLIL
jgi:mercuric ion transport protein